MKLYQHEKPFRRDPQTQIIEGAEGFVLSHADQVSQHGSHAVLFLHGWTSTPREMRPLAEAFAAAGYYSQGILFKGHGLTVRALKGVNFKDYLDQSLEAFSELAKNHDQVSVCGLSFGGLLALHLAARRKVANLILLAPFIFPYGNTLGLFPNRWLLKKLPEFIGSIGKGTEGPILDKEAAKDHIAYHEMPTQELMSIMEGAQEILPVLKNINSPTLIFQSVEDKTSDFSGAVEIIKRLGSVDKTLIALNRSNHVITLDYDRPHIEKTALNWLNAHS